jgi:thymidylate synthase (FAD)
MSTPSCKVTLLSHTKYIKETIYCVWKKSREPDYQYTPEQLHELSGGTFGQEIDELFTQVINTALPVAEQIQFVFWLDNVPISLREQIVRHRIGTKINGVPDVDVIPDLTDSTWWAQGMRVLDMGTFATDKNYYIPQSVIDKEAVEVYTSSMQVQEKIYQHLTELGIPREDARQVIPLGATHGMSWSLNLQAIKHIIGHRSCWILQIGMWRDLLLGMIQELVKIEPSFRSLINPPCMKEDTYVDCIYQVDNHRRMSGVNVGNTFHAKLKTNVGVPLTT